MEILAAELVLRAVPDPASNRGVDTKFIWEVLRRLRERCRKVLVLRFIDDLPHKEIADRLGVHISTVTASVSRCLKKAQKIAMDLETQRHKPGKAV